MNELLNVKRRILFLLLLCLPAYGGLFANNGMDKVLTDVLERHKLGDMAQPFHDAVVWNNDVYALQKHMGQCRLIRFKYDDKGELQFMGHKTVNANSATHRDMSMVVWCGKLYVFWNDGESHRQVYYTYVDFNEEGDNGENLDNLVVHKHYKVTDETGNTDEYSSQCSGYLEAVVFQGKLFLGIGVEDNTGYTAKNGLELRVSETVPDDKNQGQLVFSRGVTNVKDTSQSTVTLFAASGSRIWDMAVWRGNVNGKPGERLVVGVLHDKKLKVYAWDGYKVDSKGTFTKEMHPWTSSTSQPEVGDSYGLKLVQGALATDETYTNENLNSMLFVYGNKKTDNIQIYRYLPERQEFYDKPINTGTDDGHMGVVANYIPDESGYTDSKYLPYRMYIHIISAWELEHNYCTTLIGNWARITSDHVTLSLSSVKKMPSLRSLIKLQYVLEGMPPTPIVKEDDFKSAVDNLGYVSSITIGKRNDLTSTLEWELDFKAVATIGYQGKEDDDSDHAHFSLGGHGNFQEVNTKSVSKSVTKKLDLVNLEDLTKGWAFYSEPVLDMNWITLYSPTDPKFRVPNYPEELRMGISDYVLAEYPFDLSVINVDGTDYSTWSNRLYGSSFINSKSVFSAAPVIGQPVMNEVEYTSETSKYTSTTRGFIFGIDMSKLVGEHLHLGFNFDLNYDHTQTQTNTNADVFTVNYPAYRTSDPHFLSGVEPKAFVSSLYALHYQYDTKNKNLSDNVFSSDKDGDASDAQLAYDYYKRLEKSYVKNAAGDSMQMRIADEFPVILAWRTGGEEPNNLRSCSLGSNQLEADGSGEALDSIKSRWFAFTPKTSGTLVAKVKGMSPGNRMILREGLETIRKYAVSRYDEQTGETTVSLQITEGEPIYVGFLLFDKLMEKREWILSMEGSTANERLDDAAFDIRAVDGYLYVNWLSDTAESLDVAIYAMNGQELYHGRHRVGESISLAGQRPGICVATVSDGKVTRSKRFMLR